MDEDEFEEDGIDEQELAEQQEQEELEEMQAISEAERRAEELVIKNKLKRLLMKVKTRNIIHIVNPDDVKTMRTARKMGAKFKPDLLQIDVARAVNMQKTVSAAISSAPMWYYIGIIALIIIAVVVVICVMAATFSFLFGGFGGDGDNSTGSSAFGVTGTDFYGVRLAYQNESLAATQAIEDYVNMATSGAENLKQTTSASVGGTEYTLQLTLNFELPTDYDYANFEESNFASSYGVIYNVAYEIAKSMYKVDNQIDFAGSSLVDCAKGVKYFGFAEVDLLAESTAQKLVDATTIQASNGSEVVTNSDVISDIKEQIKEDVANDISEEYSSLAVRAEKLFVRDIILTDEEMVSGIAKENYVHYIFMPKRQVNFKAFSFAVGGQDLQDFEISASYNGTNYAIEQDGDNLGDETNFAYLYSTEEINLSANAFTAIDTNNLTALSEEQSIFEIIKNTALSTDLYLQVNTINETNVYSLRQGGFMVTTSNSAPFIITEFDTSWE